MSSLPLRFLASWQAKQFSFRMGATSLMKLTGPFPALPPWARAAAGVPSSINSARSAPRAGQRTPEQQRGRSMVSGLPVLVRGGRGRREARLWGALAGPGVAAAGRAEDVEHLGGQRGGGQRAGRQTPRRQRHRAGARDARGEVLAQARRLAERVQQLLGRQ